MEKCVGCQFYDRNDDHVEDKGVRWGKCRRGVPIVHPVAAKAYMVEGIWPHVRDDDWCGEWKVAGRRTDARVADLVNRGITATAATPAMRPAVAPASSTSPMAALAIGAAARGND